MRKWTCGIAGLLAVGLLVRAAGPEKIDLGMLHRIKAEAFGRNSKVMDTAFYLTDVYGPRLTGSPNIKSAGDWAVKKMGEWGLANARMEAWGPFGRGWSSTHFSAEMKEPGFMPLIGFAQPWSSGTNGPVSGEAILAVISGPEDLDKFKGKLKGKVVLAAASHPSEMVATPYARRLSDADLADAETSPDPTSGNPAALPLGFTRPGVGGAAVGRAGAAGRGGRGGTPRQFRAQLNKFLKDEGVLVVLTPGNGPDGGTVMGQAAGSQNPGEEAPPPSVVITNEHYNRIVRLVEKGIPVTLAFDIAAKFTDPVDSFNITAEIPGSDPSAGFVMLGGHFDSWTGGTGATDNAAGSAVAMDAMRILKSLDVKMRRTVRIALWTGEEQGTLGSRAYVKEHFADAADMKTKPEHAKLSAYYNLDNGSGKIRGIYIQDNDEARPIFESWVEPLKDLGATALTIRNTGSTDHIPFDAVGLPAFQFIQDPLEYGSRSHHSNMDLYDRLQAGDLEQASAVMAWFVYNTATRPDMMPRKPMPKPGAGRGGFAGGQ
ncbi:MAG TPA: M20/M25/M40 family metallo-hydrolase [Bryobacteraceae bacterium]|nr:M20/M25/M40 family metallo-hydrolase [Bryobacteraceae bacterium]